jgi:fatty acid desaturase
MRLRLVQSAFFRFLCNFVLNDIAFMRTTLPLLTDPAEVATPPSNAYWRFWLSLIRDPRDMPFLMCTLKITLTVVPLGILLYMPFITGWWWWVIAVAYLYINNFIFKGPFGLMTHCVSHRKLFVKKYGWMNQYLPWVIGPFFGQSPGTYFSHHVGMHHPENNLEDDDSTTILFQRDSFKDFWKYVAKFVFIGFYNLVSYFQRKNRKKLRNMTIYGELSLIFFWVAMCFVNWQATVVVFILPFLISRVIMMLGNWSQHAFVDYDTPQNFFTNSITCVNTSYNHKCWNDGYHTSHHLLPHLHWTEYPDHVRNNLGAFKKNKALIFHGIHYLHIWWYLMTGNYSRLADHLINIDGMFASKQEAIALLKSRTRKMPRRGITSDYLRQKAA